MKKKDHVTSSRSYDSAAQNSINLKNSNPQSELTRKQEFRLWYEKLTKAIHHSINILAFNLIHDK